MDYKTYAQRIRFVPPREKFLCNVGQLELSIMALKPLHHFFETHRTSLRKWYGLYPVLISLPLEAMIIISEPLFLFYYKLKVLHRL